MSCVSTLATPHCITAQPLSISLCWILHRHQGYLTSKATQRQSASLHHKCGRINCEWHRNYRATQAESSASWSLMFGGRRQSEKKGESGAKEGWGGGCTAAKRQGPKLIFNWLLRYQKAEQWGQISFVQWPKSKALWKKRVRRFSCTQNRFHLRLHVRKKPRSQTHTTRFTVNSIPPITPECQPATLMYNESAACVAGTGWRLRDGSRQFLYLLTLRSSRWAPALVSAPHLNKQSLNQRQWLMDYFERGLCFGVK